MKQLTQEQAIEFYESNAWEDMTFQARAEFQISQEMLCMPFAVFHKAIEKTLSRSVWTHEFGMNWDGIKDEVFNGAEPPTLQDIIEMIPQEKRILISGE